MHKITSPRNLLVAAALLTCTATPSEAVERCGAFINPFSGNIEVYAKGVDAETFRWGHREGEEVNEFHKLSCVKYRSARRCKLAKPHTLEARTPPADCTLHVADSTGRCSTWVRGCIPGVRELPDFPEPPEPGSEPGGDPVVGSLVCDDHSTQLFVSSGMTADLDVVCPGPGQVVSGRAAPPNDRWNVDASEPVDGPTWRCTVNNPTLVAGFARCHARCCRVE